MGNYINWDFGTDDNFYIIFIIKRIAYENNNDCVWHTSGSNKDLSANK